jgi:hypothetical protein
MPAADRCDPYLEGSTTVKLRNIFLTTSRRAKKCGAVFGTDSDLEDVSYVHTEVYDETAVHREPK